jgi:hypothetical protein
MRNVKTQKKLKVIALLLALSLPIGVLAQSGLFLRGDTEGNADKQTGLLRNGEATSSLSNQTFGNPISGSDLTNQTFGVETPLGSGLLVMLMATAGYAASKTNKKNKK